MRLVAEKIPHLRWTFCAIQIELSLSCIRCCAIEYLGGIEISIWTLSGIKCRSSMRHSLRRGCMHRVFVINGSGQVREVWHAQVHEINMNDRAGRAEVNVNCADFCASRLLWNGSRFSK